MLQFKYESHLLQNFLFLGGGQSFVLFGPSTGYMRPTHPMEGNQLYSKNTDLNVNLIQNPLTEMPRKMFDHISEHCGPAKWPHKINHYNNEQD